MLVPLGQIRKSFFQIWFLSAIILLTVSFALAEKLPLRSYTTSEGLAHDRVNRIIKDSRGFLWFCTSEGLSRFDGYEFKNYTQDDGLPHRAIYDFLETRDGQLWLATGDGVVFFDPLGRSNRNPETIPETPPMFRAFRSSELKTDQNNWLVQDLIEDREGNIWAASAKGLYQLEKHTGWKLRHFEIAAARANKKEDFARLLLDRSGAIWAGTESGLYRILPDSGDVQTINIKMRVESMIEDRLGSVWVGSAGGGENEAGLHLFSITENKPHLIRIFRGRDGLIVDDWVNSLLETADGRIFVGNWFGFFEFLPQADQDQPQFHALSKEGVRSLGEDAGGNLWFSTNSSGVRRLPRNGFINFDSTDNLEIPKMSSIISGSDRETYLLTGNNKIYRFNGNTFETVAPFKMIVQSWGTGQVTFRDHLGSWWVSGATGLQRYPPIKRLEDLATTRPLKIYTTKDGLFTNEIFRLFEDSRGDIWISNIGETQNTLTRWERATDTIRRYSDEDGLAVKNAPTAFGEDAAGNIWIGYYGGGLSRYRNEKFEFFTSGDGLPAGFINSIFTDSSGRVWVATSSGGVIRIDNPLSEEKPGLENLSMHQGLSSNQATCITEDNFGRIYIGTGRGVNRLDLKTHRIKLFTKADGLPENIVSQCRRDASGALWFGTLNGLARFIPVAEQQTEAPPIFLSGLRVNGESVGKFSELGETVVENLDFAAEQRQIQIDFFALGFSTGESLRYQYKLEGIDADWSEPTALRMVNLNLSAGKYRFLVRAVNSEGATSEQAASISFQIARPVWQRWWFLTLAVLMIGFVIYSLYRYRLRRLLELERVRTRIATDLHDDIGSSLSQIAILSEVVRQKVGDNGANEPLKMIAGTSRELVDSMSDIVWAINPDKDHLSDLIQRMRRFASDVLDAKDIAYRFRFEEKNRDLSLGADIRREVYLIFKECINNLVKYADATEVEMSVLIEHNSLAVKVKDNGKGFETAAVFNENGLGGNGLVNMRRRAENLGGRFQITSGKDTGTSVLIEIPVKEKSFFRRTT